MLQMSKQRLWPVVQRLGLPEPNPSRSPAAPARQGMHRGGHRPHPGFCSCSCSLLQSCRCCRCCWCKPLYSQRSSGARSSSKVASEPELRPSLPVTAAPPRSAPHSFCVFNALEALKLRVLLYKNKCIWLSLRLRDGTGSGGGFCKGSTFLVWLI